MAGGYLYALGGGQLNSVERAAINPDGSLGPWQFTSAMNSPRENPGVVVADGYLYAVGGYGGFLTAERAQLNPDGSLDPWQFLPSMPYYRESPEVMVNQDYLYVIEGLADNASGVMRLALNPLVTG